MTIPDGLLDPRSWAVPAETLLVSAAVLGTAVVVALAIHRIAFVLIRRATAHGRARHGQPIFEAVRAPSRWLAVAIAISAVAERMPPIRPVWDAISAFVSPVIFGWLALAFVQGAAIAHERRMETRLDPIHMRSRKTRIEIFRRTASSLIIVITIALVLLSIPGVRQVGVTLMVFTGVFIARISKGRTLRGMVLGVMLVPTLFSCLWFVVFGLGSLSLGVDDVFKLIDTIDTTGILSVILTLNILLFFITSADSAGLVCEMLTVKHSRAFWIIAMAALAVVVSWLGGDVYKTLLSLISVAAIPVAFGIFALVIAFVIRVRRDRATRAAPAPAPLTQR